jgi:hypothetical protein
MAGIHKRESLNEFRISVSEYLLGLIPFIIDNSQNIPDRSKSTQSVWHTD